MGWLRFYPKKRNAEWKQECTGQTMATDSLSPTLHLLMIFGIVISLLWLSHNTAIFFHLFLLLSPILFILFLISYSTCGRLNFRFMRSGHESLQRAMVPPS